MDEYIKRSDVLSLKHRLHNHSKDTIELYPVYVISPDAVEKIPSADVAEVRHGEWEVFDEPDTNAYECTACHDVFWLSDGTPFENNYNFCPNCGADMRGGT